MHIECRTGIYTQYPLSKRSIVDSSRHRPKSPAPQSSVTRKRFFSSDRPMDTLLVWFYGESIVINSDLIVN